MDYKELIKSLRNARRELDKAIIVTDRQSPLYEQITSIYRELSEVIISLHSKID